LTKNTKFTNNSDTIKYNKKYTTKYISYQSTAPLTVITAEITNTLESENDKNSIIGINYIITANSF